MEHAGNNRLELGAGLLPHSHLRDRIGRTKGEERVACIKHAQVGNRHREKVLQERDADVSQIQARSVDRINSLEIRRFLCGRNAGGANHQQVYQQAKPKGNDKPEVNFYAAEAAHQHGRKRHIKNQV